MKRVKTERIQSVPARTVQREEWIAQAVPLPRSPKQKICPRDSGSIFPELDETLLDIPEGRARVRL